MINFIFIVPPLLLNEIYAHVDVVPQNPARSAINAVETLDEDSRDEGCFKNKKFFIEESSSAQTMLKVSHKCSTGRSCENNAILSADLCLDH